MLTIALIMIRCVSWPITLCDSSLTSTANAALKKRLETEMVAFYKLIFFRFNSINWQFAADGRVFLARFEREVLPSSSCFPIWTAFGFPIERFELKVSIIDTLDTLQFRPFSCGQFEKRERYKVQWNSMGSDAHFSHLLISRLLWGIQLKHFRAAGDLTELENHSRPLRSIRNI